MSDGTKIEWTDATVNAVNGCSVLSPGCTNCYAMRLAGTRMKHHPSRAGLTRASKAGPVWTGEVRFNEAALLQPLKWRRPRRIFWNAHGDLFHENVSDQWIDRCFAVMALTPQHQHQVLTKRAERMRAYLEVRPQARWAAHAVLLRDAGKIPAGAMFQIRDPLPNVWLGVSVEDQARADERIPHLLATPAAVRFLSCEPLLGPVDLRKVSCWEYPKAEVLNALSGRLEGMFGGFCATCLPRLDWVIVGGESGPGARPMQPDWARSLRDQCAAAGVPFFFKQWGEFAPTSDCNGPYMMHVGKRAAGRLLDGVTHDGMPE
jgi:protein gp37